MCELCHIYKCSVITLRRPCGFEYCGCVCVCFMLILMFCSLLAKYMNIYMNIYRNNKFTLNRTFRLFCVSSRCGVTLDLLVNELRKRRAAHGDFYQKFEVFLRSADMSITEIVDCAKRLIESYPEIYILLFLFLFYHAPSLAGHDFW